MYVHNFYFYIFEFILEKNVIMTNSACLITLGAQRFNLKAACLSSYISFINSFLEVLGQQFNGQI